MNDPLIYKIAISMIPGIGNTLAKNLIAYTGNVEEVFHESLRNLKKIPGIGEINASKIKDKQVLKRAENELEYIQKNKIRTYFYTDDNYPSGLKNCIDSPVIFYTMGDIDFDTEKIISIVGTRNATSYGREICETLIREISQKYKNVLIVSGLAYGIDICAHKASLKYNIPTVGILGHGLDKLYPFVHRAIAEKMLESGGLATDFPGKTKIEPANFLRRNRIIAGLSDVTIIVESGEKGGALITADIASSYNRDVCAFPGRINDPQSKGCNMLIKKNGAAMIESLKDLEYLMGWERDFFKNQIQPVLFPELTNDEKKIFELLNSGDEFFIDKISQLTKYPINKVSSLLLNMEFKDVIVSLPGKMYKLKDL